MIRNGDKAGLPYKTQTKQGEVQECRTEALRISLEPPRLFVKCTVTRLSSLVTAARQVMKVADNHLTEHTRQKLADVHIRSMAGP